MSTESSSKVSARKQRKSTKIVLTAENSELKRQVMCWRAIGSVARRAARGETFNTVMNEGVRDCATVLDANLVVILLLNEDGSHLFVHSSLGLDTSLLAPVPVESHEPLVQTARRVIPDWLARRNRPRGENAGLPPDHTRYFPISFEGIPVGVLCVGRDVTQPPFSPAEREFLEDMASEIGITGFLRGPARLMIARERAEREMHFAHTLKARILPAHVPELPNLRLSVRFLRSLDGGGDFYDFVRLADDRFAVVVGECTGRGMKAALQLAHIIPNLRGSLAEGADVEKCLRTLNAGLVQRGQRGQMVSLCFLEVDHGQGRLCLGRAGSTALYTVGPNGVKSHSGGTGTPLGVLQDADIAVETLPFQADTSLVFCTDGLNKCHDSNGVAFSGERLQMVLSQLQGQNRGAEDLAQGIAEHIAENSEPEVLRDDVTLLSVECLA